MATQTEIAKQFASAGIRVFPQDRNKKPIYKGWQTSATTDHATIDTWAKDLSKRNINWAILTGKGSGVFGVDIDIKNDIDGMKAWEDCTPGESWKDTKRTRTGSGGTHLLYRWDNALDDLAAKAINDFLPGVEIKISDVGMTMAGSFYADGRQYVEIGNNPVQPAPSWLIKKIKGHKAQPVKKKTTDKTIPSGERNNTLTSLAGRLQKQGIPGAAMVAALQAENESRCDPPLPIKEIQDIAESVGKYTPDPDNVIEFKGPVDAGITSKVLLDTEFPDPVWLLEGLLPEGFTLLAGKPKIGKSWFSLQIAAAVSVGVTFLKKYKTNKTRVLCLALEDSRRRIKQRFSMIGGLGSDDLDFRVEWSCGLPGLKAIRDEIERVRDDPKAKTDIGLVIIDTLSAFMGGIDINDHEAMTSIATSIKKIYSDYGVSILLIHHTRKSGGADFVDSVAGSHAITATPDATMVISRGRGEADGFLVATGRDQDDVDIALKLVKDEGWEYLGNGAEHRATGTQKDIIEMLKLSNDPLSPKDVSMMLNSNPGTVRQTMCRMENTGIIHKVSHGKYTMRDGV